MTKMTHNYFELGPVRSAGKNQFGSVHATLQKPSPVHIVREISSGPILTTCAAALVMTLSGSSVVGHSGGRVVTAHPVVTIDAVRGSRNPQRDAESVREYAEGEYVIEIRDLVAVEQQEHKSEEVNMLSPADLDHRERIFKTTVNGVVLLMGAGIACAVFGVLSWIDVVPGVLAGIGVLGSCGIQLNKVDALRK